jgi:uncharacterized protein YprB with RNaseH-like and TPR domain
MAQNLRDRLRRIRDIRETRPDRADEQSRSSLRCPRKTDFAADNPVLKGWVSAGFQTLKREITEAPPRGFPVELPGALPVVISDLARYAKKNGEMPAPEDFLFFDLETTGLSGGAGTTAFLAAFGRLVYPADKSDAEPGLRITQYLLLDYPGENDFLEALLGEFAGRDSVIVSYNGKSFDSHILKTRCLMNGIRPPEYSHVDLLHPARRLWKRILGDCSQGTIETGILGLDRSGDVPGALAPEIWFGFLKTGDAAPLSEICGHNRRDISGLASIFAAMNHIAADPPGALEKYNYDVEQLALHWRGVLRRGLWRDDVCGQECRDDLRKTGDTLLHLAVEKGCPGAVLAYARDLIRRGDCAEGRRLLLCLAAAGESPTADGVSISTEMRAAALHTLAVDSEWRLGDAAGALDLVNRGLALPLPGASRRMEFERRAERLEKKTRRRQESADQIR